MSRTLTLLKWLLIGMGTIAASYYLYISVIHSLEAEQTHHTYLAVLDAVTLYVQDNHEWPPGWKALSDFALRRDPSQFEYLKDVTEVSQRVDVRFDITLVDIASMTAEDFSAITPRGANYGTSPSRINRILELARQLRGTKAALSIQG